MELRELIFKFINRYFDTLSKTAYIPKKTALSIIALLFMKDLLDDYLVPEKDFLRIIKAITCLTNSSCILSFNDYIRQHTHVTPVRSLTRITEDNYLRITENTELRVIE